MKRQSAILSGLLVMFASPSLAQNDTPSAVTKSVLSAFGVPDLPPVQPGPDETNVTSAQSTPEITQLAKCYNDTKASLENAEHAFLQIRLGAPHITYSRTWGYVLRADFTRVGTLPGQVNRLRCWHGYLETDLRESVPPLDHK